MNENDTDLPRTDFATRMKNRSAKSEHDDYKENKITFTNILTNEQIEAVRAKNWFTVLELDADLIKIGDIFVHNYYHYKITGINNFTTFGFKGVHFTRTGPMMPQRRRLDLEAVPA